ncbi:MAG TPA: 1-(5-phosphoribosyl)-5-((5-phosphoribosylamino)methylideneamino)imidazole-4-carboxamide isomerase, partial [Anaerolineae bacterium]|nr:1-(5-phosphoribosyl)-5-((5-phosphoribosylamino)methylideneamino)imidazole-4-carboxamide isomerase [Anaerolineae bacterium]
DDIALALELGATRVVLGTAAVQNPDLVRDSLARFGPERIVIGIDARDGRVATHGWRQISELRALDLARAMADAGVQRIVYTDISRDGMLSGVNLAGSVDLARASGLKVIASGGVSSLDDIRALAAHEADGVEGVIVGQALYTGQFTLPEALLITDY